MGLAAESEARGGAVWFAALRDGVDEVEFEERRKKRGMKSTARMMAAAALTRKSLLERPPMGGDGTRRGPGMVALT